MLKKKERQPPKNVLKRKASRKALIWTIGKAEPHGSACQMGR
jgi:hypothetical protein